MFIRKGKETVGEKNHKTATVLRNVVAAFGIKGLALIVSLFTIPAYMRFFADQEVLGVWYTILSVLTWMLNFDFGIGNGLRNKLSTTLAQRDTQETRAYISSAYWMIGIGMIAFTVIGSFVIPFANWNQIFNVSTDIIPADTMIIVMQYTFIGIMLQFFLRLISSILYAMQKSSINNLIALITSVLQLLFVLVAPAKTPVESLKMFSVAYVISANLPLLVATIVVFTGPLKHLWPHFRYIQKNKARAVMSLGGIFFVCQLLYMVIANTNEFFVTQYTGPENVVDYQIYYRLFSLGSMVINIALTPIWSIVTKAIAENDIDWLRKLYKNLKKFTWIGVACEFLLVAGLRLIINIWLGDQAIAVNYYYALAFALFGSVMMYQGMLSSIVCGMGKMKLQAIAYGIGVIAKVLIIHFGMMLTGSWITVVVANVMILIPYCILQQRDLDKQFG